MKCTIYCHECEHEGDMNNYLYDIRNSGAKVLSHEIFYDSETGEIHVEIDDLDKFNEKFQETDSYDFCHVGGGY
jgi:hypothetical protein